MYQVVHSAPQASNDYTGDLAKSIVDGTAGVNWTDEEKKSNSTANINKDGYIKYKKKVEERFFRTISEISSVLSLASYYCSVLFARIQLMICDLDVLLIHTLIIRIYLRS